MVVSNRMNHLTDHVKGKRLCFRFALLAAVGFRQSAKIWVVASVEGNAFLCPTFSQSKRD